VDRPPSPRERTASLAAQIAGVVGVAFFFALSFLVGRMHAWTRGTVLDVVVTVVQYVMFALSALALLGLALELRRVLQARRAQRASARVDEALKAMQSAEPWRDVAEIAPHQVAAAVKDAQVSDDQLLRLVEQRRQRILIDDAVFSQDVRMIVDYLQPLPRNAKRVLNRFRVNLLIADRRGLFVSEPKVSKEQIGKWLVLSERWPQLRQSLSATPEKMAGLERAAWEAPSPVTDSFMDAIKTLAPFYLGDEDLRKFLQSPPGLADILPRLVHYGSPQ
jgi:hypothetical protein